MHEQMRLVNFILNQQSLRFPVLKAQSNLEFKSTYIYEMMGSRTVKHPMNKSSEIIYRKSFLDISVNISPHAYKFPLLSIICPPYLVKSNIIRPDKN